jgi:hypothetical protein
MRKAARFLWIIFIIISMMWMSRVVGEYLFSSYYAMEWGISAEIMHSPPFGENYTNKLAIVIQWSLLVGALLGLLIGIFTSRFLIKPSKGKKIE